MIKFTDEQKEALWQSAWHWLENWEAAVDGRLNDVHIWGETCPCCKLWMDLSPFADISTCYGCPIQQFTGAHNCNGTPWARVNYQFQSCKCDIDTEDLEEACEREYKFLVCLALGENP